MKETKSGSKLNVIVKMNLRQILEPK